MPDPDFPSADPRALWARAAMSDALDPATIAAGAGQPNPTSRQVIGDWLLVEGVDQAALDAAVAGFDAAGHARRVAALTALRALDQPPPRIVEDIAAAVAGEPLSDHARDWLAAKAAARSAYRAVL